MKRKAKIARKTKETNISVDINIDGKGKYKIDTGIGFFNHMLEQLSKHSMIDLKFSRNKIIRYVMFFQCNYNTVVKCEDQNNVAIKFKV